MRLLTFSYDGRESHVGAQLTDETLLDLTGAAGGDPAFSSLLNLIDSGESGLARAQSLLSSHGFEEHTLSIDAVRVLAPIPRPRKNVYCVGLNFRSHVEQNAAALGEQAQIPEVPLFFSKPVTAVIGPGDAIVLDERLTTKLDYEVELALVIGQGGKWISSADAPAHIFGYTIANDVSARDLQWRTSQFLYGKGQDTYCPLGPIVRTADEVDVNNLTLDLLVNGDLRQSESAGNMLFPPAEVVAWLSQGITLEPGDIITLGTPGGCGYQLSPPQYLQAGDVVECRITSLGTLANHIENA
jgi:2-keto-4-pentenoate hydratase/2-oxohepta-3-ene-1,7-dioic acid hydratase (catechol pathway)